ncbi:helix-turn-helix domain-containing protein [Nocardia brevicatena]|uniref:helix-turn-helix domain-containing protein n=1 Tax=Nocardia brevicatena TaxID=37327 RepID=UPI0002E2D396|nr:helix-turn-helix transcriptional regulator [Nocardia brevicatena]
MDQWRFFGDELKRLRGQESLRSLARRINYNAGNLSRIERGLRKPAPDVVLLLDRELSASGRLIEIAAVASFHLDVDGRGMLGHDDLHENGEGCMPLSRRDFIATATLGTSVPQIMFNRNADIDYLDHFRQLKRVLVDQDSLLGPTTVIPIVQQQIQVMSQLRKLHGMDAVGLLNMQTNYAEFAGWLYQDLGDFAAAEYWTDRAFQWSMAAGNDVMSSYILNRKAHLSGDAGDGGETVALAAAAIRRALGDAPIESLANMRAGHGHALLGDHKAAENAYDEALKSLDDPDMDPDLPWSGRLDTSYITVHRADSLSTLGKFDRAVEHFTQVLDALPPRYARDRTVYTVRAAIAHAGNNEVEHAAGLGMEALTAGQGSGSGRLAMELQRLDKVLIPWQSQPAVAQFWAARRSLPV